MRGRNFHLHKAAAAAGRPRKGREIRVGGGRGAESRGRQISEISELKKKPELKTNRSSDPH